MNKFLATMAFAGSLMLGAAGANAAVTFGTGNPGNTGTDNVIFNGCPAGLTQANATTVQGCLNTGAQPTVNFTSNELLSASGGQALVTANDGAFTVMEIAFADNTLSFTKIIFTLNTDGTGANADSGNVIITAFLEGGGTDSDTFAISGNASNFFFVTSDGGDEIIKIKIESDIGINSVAFDDVAQVRLGGVSGPTDVPEPGTLALIGGGLLGLAYLVRRRRSA